MTRQQRTLAWCVETFGPESAARTERIMRFMEEAIELAHSVDLPMGMIAKLCVRVYGGEKDNPAREIGQVLLTLEALAESMSLNVESETETEIDRIMALPNEHWKRRHDAKRKEGIA